MSEPIFLLLSYALEHVLASGIIALIVLALCRIKTIPAGAKARILFVALMLSVLGPVLPIRARMGDAANTPRSLQAGVMTAQAASAVPDRAAAQVASWTSQTPGRIEIDRPMAAFLIAFWSLGMAWQLARQARAHASLRRIVAMSKRSRALEDRHRHILPARAQIRLCASFGPAVVGLAHPKILVPERLAASLPEDALRAVLLHEATHIRRNDLAAHALQKIVEAVFWWNPMVRWMGATLDATREIACDIEASRGCKTPADYADALLTAIEHIVPAQQLRFASALGVTDALRSLDRRIDGIIEARTTSGPGAKLASMTVLLTMAAGCAAVEAVSRPLAPIPEAYPDKASAGPIAPERTANAIQAAVGEVAKPVFRSPAPAASKPHSGEAALGNANGGQAAAEKHEDRLSTEQELRSAVSQVEQEFRSTAAQADEEFRNVASQADEEFRGSAAQADEKYLAAAGAADATYMQRFAELEHVTPAAAYEARLAQVSDERSRAVSAAGGQYRTRMAEANGKYRTQMAQADGKYRSQMAGAKARYESATKAWRMN